MSYKELLIDTIAEILLIDDWQPRSMVHRIDWLFQAEPNWVIPLVDNVVQTFPDGPPAVTKKQIAEVISADRTFLDSYKQQLTQLRIRQFYLQQTTPPLAKLTCEIPSLDNTKELANWLGLNVGQLENYSTHWRSDNQPSKIHFRHYHYRWILKPGGRTRLIEAPKQKLADVQRQIYLGILAHIPLHSACHGFRKNHSCLSYAQPHAGKKVVVHMDLENFFISIQQRRIHALFTSIGYRTSIARLLAGISCNQTPGDIIKANPALTWHQSKQLLSPHLPQGSPSSPALANLCSYKLDLRLAALAKKLNGHYTRYADDLAFSGNSEFAKKVRYLPVQVARIAQNEGFSVNHRKTNVMHQGLSQRLTGMTLNAFPNYPRKEYEQLKAILFNSVRYGPKSQNKKNRPDMKAHLQGKIAFVKSLNPARAEKLDKIFQKINWMDN